MTQSIVLIGVPGAGKTTVGELLAAHLGLTFVDSDHVIEAQAGKAISEIFTDDGEAVFRSLEADVISELLSGSQQVISLGGGALGNAITRDLVKKHIVVWLETGLSQAVERVGLNRNRPLLLGNVRSQLSALMTAREPIYREAATITIDTSNRDVAQVVQATLHELTPLGITP